MLVIERNTGTISIRLKEMRTRAYLLYLTDPIPETAGEL